MINIQTKAITNLEDYFKINFLINSPRSTTAPMIVTGANATIIKAAMYIAVVVYSTVAGDSCFYLYDTNGVDQVTDVET